MGTPLSASLAAGDRDAFAALYDRLGLRLFNTARTMLAFPAEAEDVVHDLFVELARLRHRLADVADDRLAIELRDDPFGRHYAALTAPPRPAVAAVATSLAGPTADTGVSRAAFRMIDVRRLLLEENP